MDGAATASIRDLNCTGVITGVLNYVKYLLPCNDFGFFEKLMLDALRNRIDSSYALIILHKVRWHLSIYFIPALPAFTFC